MGPTKKPKVKLFKGINSEKQVKEINDFLSQHESINAKSIAISYEGRVLLLYEE